MAALTTSRRLLRFVVPTSLRSSISRSITSSSSSRITSSISQPSLLLTRRNSGLWFDSSSRPFSSYSSTTSRHPPSSSHGAEVERVINRLEKELRVPREETAAAIKKLVAQGGCSSQLAATLTEVINEVVDNRICHDKDNASDEYDTYDEDETSDEEDETSDEEDETYEQGSSKLRKVVRGGSLLLLGSLGYYLYEKGVIKVDLDKI